MRAVVIDDETPSLNLMKIVMGENPDLELVGAFSDPEEALRGIAVLHPDVVFTDVEMPKMSGMELARKIRAHSEDIQIVFITAYEQYALGAFEVDAANYILKPFTQADLKATVRRLLKNRRGHAVFSEEPKRNRIITLGGFAVYGAEENRAVRWPTAKVQELFAFFVFGEGREADKWTLCDLLWPHALPRKAEHSLHSAVSRVKQALREEGIPNLLSCEKGKYRMDLSRFSCDAWDLTRFLREHPAADEENLADYERALSLYRGELFGREDYVWAMDLKQKIAGDFLEGIQKVARFHMEKGRCENAGRLLRRALEINPCDEESAELLMRACARAGEKAELAACYRRLERALRAELGITPPESARRLYRELLAAL